MKKLTQYNVKFTFTTISGKIIEEIVLIAAIDSDSAKRIVSNAYKKSMISINISSVGSNGMIHVEDTDIIVKESTKNPFGLSDVDMISNKLLSILENTTKFKLLSPNKLDFYQGEESVLMELQNYIEKLTK